MSELPVYLENRDGKAIGADPREIGQEALKAIGHRQMSPMKAIRARCIDCCAGSMDEVRKCVAVKCPSWPFRMGKNPWRQPRRLRAETPAAGAVEKI